VLIVVILIGILSMMAYASLLDHIYLLRTRDAATNTAAFLNRVSAEAKRMDTTVCVQLYSAQRMVAYQAPKDNNCTEARGAVAAIDSFGVIPGFRIEAKSIKGITSLNENSVISMVPQIGLSALPRETGIVLNYSRNFCAGAVKTSDQNNAIGYFSRDNCDSWGTM
jgi:Tfp pilus assembly protein PilE